MILVAMSGVPSYLRTGKGDVVTRLMGGFCQWVRDDLVEPAMGKELSEAPAAHDVRLLLHPVHEPDGADAGVRDRLGVRDRRARLITFVLHDHRFGMIAQGPVNFFKNLVPHVPLFLWPLLFVIELLGLLIVPVALMIRLFATMTGGHLVVLTLPGADLLLRLPFMPALPSARHSARSGWASRSSS